MPSSTNCILGQVAFSRPDMSRDGILETALKRDRTVVVGAIGLLVTLSALYTIAGVGMNMSAFEMTFGNGGSDMPGMGSMSTPMAWSLGKSILIFLMWWVMMIAMMVPSAAPTILLFAAVLRRGNPSAPTPRRAVIFTAGYLLAWAFFSVVAAFTQWFLEMQGAVSQMGMMLTNSRIGAAVLLVAGVYQISPWKQTCLSHCQSPAEHISRHFRPGNTGALRMGLYHGTYCLGCCAGLMALLFVGGIMNLYWIVGLAALVALEKLWRHGLLAGKLAGVGLILWGAAILAGLA